MLALLDFDSACWILAYNFREHMDEPSADIDIARAADDFVKTILTIVQADSYVGVFSPEKNFRHELYKYAKYKGERPERPDWFVRFGPVVKQRLIDKWGFFTVPDLEADDVVCALAEYYGTNRTKFVQSPDEHDPDLPGSGWVTEEVIICSPDKDLRQIAGLHYDYKKEGAVPFRVTADEAQYNFWYQMMCGDDSDNVKAVPGLGPVKAKKLLNDCEDSILWGTLVMGQYVKYFGNYYGPIIYQETKDTLQLMSSRHRLWYLHGFWFDERWGAEVPIAKDGHLIGNAIERLRSFNNTLEEASPFSEKPQMNVWGIVTDKFDIFGE